MDIPVMIRRMAKRMKDERYRRTITPNTKVGLRSAIAAVNQFAPFALLSRLEDEGSRFLQLSTSATIRLRVTATKMPFTMLQLLCQKDRSICCLLQLPIQPWRAEVTSRHASMEINNLLRLVDPGQSM